MSSKRKKLYLPALELRLILAGGGLLCALLIFNSQIELWALSLLQAVLGILYTLCVPGYLLQLILFPRREDLNWDGRLGLSFGLSIAIVAPLALALDQFEAGLSLVPFTAAWMGVILLLVMIAAVRQLRLAPAERAGLRWSFSFRSVWAGENKSGRWLLVLLFLTLLVGLGAGIGLALLPLPSSSFTEFYILGEAGLAESYPYTLAAGQPFEIIVGVRNLEGEAHYYQVQAWDGSGLIGASLPFVLKDGELTEFGFTFTPVETGPDVKIRFELFINGGLQPYRALHLYTRVVAQD
jgi:uncharacterized membrane protein